MFVTQGLQGSLPDGLPPEQVTYEWFAENYHFTEQMTDSLSLAALEWWPVIRLAKVKAQAIEQAREERVAKAKAR